MGMVFGLVIPCSFDSNSCAVIHILNELSKETVDGFKHLQFNSLAVLFERTCMF